MSEGATSVPSTAGPVPLVSVGMPVHNGAAFLQEAIDSVLRQDYPNLELVICDNASDDGTEAICRHAALIDPRVRYLRNSTDIGLVENFRRTLDEARGRYFTWLAHDDVLSDPAYLTTLAGYLEDHPEAVLCACAVRLLNSEYGVSGEVIAFPELAPEKWPAGRNEFFRLPHGWDGLVIYGVCRTGTLRSLRFPERTFRGRPHIFWWETDVMTQLCLRGRLVALPEALRSYRLAVTTAGTGLATSFSTLDLFRIGFGIKLLLIYRALRMPGPRTERVRLVGTALANLFRANLGQPYGHAFVRRNWEVAVAGLQKAAGERRQAVAILRTAIAERRKLLISIGADPGPLPESVAEALSLPDEPLDDEGLKALPSGRGYSRGVVADFFRPPSPEQIEARIRLQAAVGSLTVLCRKLLDTAEILNGEARRLEGLLDSSSAEGRGMPV